MSYVRYPRIYAALITVGHSRWNALQLIGRAINGDKMALTWIKSIVSYYRAT
jgi:hypothetical protein